MKKNQLLQIVYIKILINVKCKIDFFFFTKFIKLNILMPTQFTNCAECDYDIIVKKYYKENDNCKYLYDLHNENIEKFNILQQSTKLPKEICIKILKESSKFTNCNYCERKLCFHHAECAKRWAKYYRNVDNQYMCKQCCWWEVS